MVVTSTSAWAFSEGLEETPLALTVVTQSPEAWSLMLTVRVTVSDSPSPTETTDESKLEVNPLQSDSCEELRETVRSSSPVFMIVMSYSAASSVVAVEFVGLAVIVRSAPAIAGVETKEASSSAAIMTAESGLLID